MFKLLWPRPTALRYQRRPEDEVPAIGPAGALCRRPLRHRSSDRDQGAALRILAMNLDTATPTGRLMLDVFGSVAQFEREVMLERQRGDRQGQRCGQVQGKGADSAGQGFAGASATGKGMTREAIAGELKIGVASAYRILRVVA
jgi:Resolvase, N terminal domain